VEIAQLKGESGPAAGISGYAAPDADKVEADNGRAAGDSAAPKPKKGKYQHKTPARPPKRVRRVLTRSNPEVLRKLEELKETERRLFPEAAAERERRETEAEDERRKVRAKTSSGQGAPLSRKARRDLKKYGVTAQGAGRSYSSRKLLSFRMLFAEMPIEEASDSEVAANMRLLFLAHSDHNMPKNPDKFVAYLRNSLCSGISGDQLERVMDILARYGYVNVSKDRINVTVE
jgi:hypothetical protein